MLWFAEAVSLDQMKLTLAGRSIPLAPSLLEQGPQALWQIPFPAGMISGTTTFDLQLEGGPFKLRGMAVTGAEIHPRHLAQLETSPGMGSK